jgi:diguanylate cyclase (GGDEF)-like protein
MKRADMPISSNGAGGRILLVGDISRAFFDAGTVTKDLCEVTGSLSGALEAASRNNFKLIGIVISGLSARLSSALKTLREAGSKARIVLLAQMYEEPLARRFVRPASNGMIAADDYLICPLQLQTLFSSVMYTGHQEQADSALITSVNANLEKRIRQLEVLATTDDLTGLKNRRYIWEFCRQILEHARKENGRVTLLVFDIDDFKHYNDVYGHPVGDMILKQAAILMQRCCREHDVVGRIGGDEFAVVFWDDPQSKAGDKESERRSTAGSKRDHPKEVIFIAKRFIKELEKAEFAEGGLGPKGRGVLTISGGLAGFPRDGSSEQELFLAADSALLEAKRSGKNRIYLVGQQQNDIADIE